MASLKELFIFEMTILFLRIQNMRLRHSSSPMGSTGSSNESWPSSKEEDSEMYSHANDKHAKTSTDEEPDDDMEEPNESWDEVCFERNFVKMLLVDIFIVGNIKWFRVSESH